MNKRSKKPARRRQWQSPQGLRLVREWVGGICSFPGFVGTDMPVRPEMTLWLELPSDLVVGTVLSEPDEAPPSFSESLDSAQRQPLAGPPRVPSRVRIADPRLAQEIIDAFPALEVVVAPTPELDSLVANMLEHFGAESPGNDSGYLNDGLVAIDTVADLFDAARRLYQTAPWQVMDDAQVLRLDIPSYSVDGACVSVIGALGESLGVMIFPSLLHYDRFLLASELGWDEDALPDIGTDFLALNFERATELPVAMRSEAAKYGWPVDNVNAYPWVQPIGADLISRAATEHEIRIVTACANGLIELFNKHHAVLDDFLEEAISERFTDGSGVEVTWTVPYDPEQFDVPAPFASRGSEGGEGVPPELAQLVAKQFLERHYREWPDYPLPALKGKTPRQAMKSKRGRAQVDALLRVMQSDEAGMPMAERIDFDSVRQDLGFEI
jgi:hypothetical protein